MVFCYFFGAHLLTHSTECKALASGLKLGWLVGDQGDQMSSWKNRPKRSPAYTSLNFIRNLKRGKKQLEIVLLLLNFAQNCPKKTITQWAKIRPICSPWTWRPFISTFFSMHQSHRFKAGDWNSRCLRSEVSRWVTQVCSWVPGYEILYLDMKLVSSHFKSWV
jgi:hypothetical protein